MAASSIQLKACGGLGPYSWTKTGNVTLSASTGTLITVTPNGNCTGATVTVTDSAGVSSTYAI